MITRELAALGVSSAHRIPFVVVGVLLVGIGGSVSGAAATSTASAGTPPSAHPHIPVDFQPGAPGIGDPYFPLDGNGGYDVEHYDLDLSYEPTTDILSGVATISSSATQDLSSLNLDLDGLTVEAITVDDEPATWSTATTQIRAVTGQPLAEGSADPVASPPRTELTVVPSEGIEKGSEFTTVVTYSGIPVTVNDVFGPVSGVIHTDDGMLVVGQPRVAATWFPANDHPADKASFSFRVSVPEGLQVVANGRLVGESFSEGRSIWEWEADDEMATYLATASVGEFTFTALEEGDITYLSAIDPDLLTLSLPAPNPDGLTYGGIASDIFATEPEVVAFLETQFGPYPFADAGGIADDVDALAFALENQTRPIYPLWAFADPADPRVVVHELAHQWYGDSVALEHWSDIWLNEGFATYAEWLWAENAGGTTVQEQVDTHLATDPADPLWAVTVGDPGPAGIFDGAVYVRGALTLHALRVQVGDDVFFEILKGWAMENAGGNVTTAQFIDYAEASSGEDLSALFQTWLYTPTKP